MAADKDPLHLFHPAVAGWFRATFAAPSEAQRAAWPAIKAASHTLIAAPTGSGKTLAAFLCAIDELVREAEGGPLPDETRVVYVSPLKALSNDIERNLQAPLRGVHELLAEGAAEIRVGLRTGDTPSSARTAMTKRPPHIVVTTPESLYLLLTSAGGRAMLATTRTVIVDEIHAVLGAKRGAHLALSLERLDALAAAPVTRIGLSATQRPIETAAAFLTGAGAASAAAPAPDCRIIDTGHRRAMDVGLELPGSPLEAVMANEVWDELYQRLTELILEHRTTLVFVNNRRLSERMSHALGAVLGEEQVAAHHGSLSRERRLDAEQRLKAGALRVIVATASLELGIDIGEVDLVCQFGSPRSIMAFLQRVGRSGHHISGTPKGRLFPLSRDELVECSALLAAAQQGELDRIVVPEQPLDVLAQQIVAEVSAREWAAADLFAVCRRAWPYRTLERGQFDAVVTMLAEGFSTARGRRAAYLHHDVIGGRLRGRRGAGLAALTNGGAIPDNFDFQVRVDPQDLFIGTVHEDFAVESVPGDIFLLGNKSWEILKVETGVVRVADAAGKPPTLPFWLGEAPGRSNELSRAVSALRTRIRGLIEDTGAPSAVDWLVSEVGLDASAADQLVDYLHAGLNALGTMPTHDTAVMERFFDEAGDMHLVIHSPRGSRLNRAWGLALRKRFCRNFNFELQAAANEDSLVLSLGQTHSFPLADVWRYLNRNTVREVLTQALLDAPVFQTRWRWNATCALAILRQRGGKRVAPYLQRMQSEDLLSLVFPDQLACQENITGEREIPDHPLVSQAIGDCLHEAMDIGQLEELQAAIAGGGVELVARDLREPSPFAEEIINARPYAFLDDAPLEERRTQAIRNRRWTTPEEAREFGALDASAIARVREEALPRVTDADELHDALDLLTFIDEQDGLRAGWGELLHSLVAHGRATRIRVADAAATRWIAAERLPLWRALFDSLAADPELALPAVLTERTWRREEALREVVRGRMEAAGPVSSATLARQIGVPGGDIDAALLALETEGAVLRGEFTGSGGEEWCERRLLARIHRYTISRLRREIEPLAFDDFVRFLFAWQSVPALSSGGGGARGGGRNGGRDGARGSAARGSECLLTVVQQLAGYEAAAAAWEEWILPARLPDYDPAWLDLLCAGGDVAWARLRPPARAGAGSRTGPLSSSPIALAAREEMALWRSAAQVRAACEQVPLSANAAAVHACLTRGGALFRDEIQRGAHLLPSQVDGALAELAAAGVATCDSFAGLRALIRPVQRSAGERRRETRLRRAGASFTGNLVRPRLATPTPGRRDGAGNGTPAAPRRLDRSGRWSLLGEPAAQHDTAQNGAAEADFECVAMRLLERYGVVFRRLLERETLAPSWGELVAVYRRLEARGLIRGGYFVSGVGGEQFALADAITRMRAVRRAPAKGELRVLSAVDPAANAGIKVHPSRDRQRIAAVRGNRILYRDGVPIAVREAGAVRFLDGDAAELTDEDRWQLERLLLVRDARRARRLAKHMAVAGRQPAAEPVSA
jgi:ATP-dependent Lhr-like helicase